MTPPDPGTPPDPVTPSARATPPAPHHRLRRRGRIAIAGVVLLLALAAGWWWAFFGRPVAQDASMTPVTTRPLAGEGVALAALQPGACLAGLDSQWQAGFEVVDCSIPHPAQYLGAVGVEEALGITDGAWPGEQAVAERAQWACQNDRVLDAGAAAGIPALLAAVQYPRTAEEWDGGVREYRCFVVSSSEFTGSVAA